MGQEQQQAPEPAPAERGHRWFAAFYQFSAAAMERGAVGRIRRELLAGLGGDVLEIGAGAGANFALYPEAARVIALEPDPHMLKRARDKARPNIEIRTGPAERLPFPDASFDAVVSTLVMCSVDDLPRSLAEARRVLRPAGALVFIEHVRGGSALGRAQDIVQPVYGWFSGGCHANRRTEQALRDAGFAFERIEREKINPLLPAIWGVARPA